MPELPEIETIKNQLLKNVLSKKITALEINWSKIIKTDLGEFQKKVVGSKIIDIFRRAKLLIIKLSSDYSLIIHLKLTGQLIYQSEKRKTKSQKYIHLIYTFSDGSQLFHNDFRKFGYVKLIKTQDLEELFQEEKFGPEPLEKKFRLEIFKGLLKRKPQAKIKPLLIDQAFIAGIGNLYSQEACWLAKILPDRKVKTLTNEEIENLYFSLKKILNQAIKYGGSSVDTYLDLSGKPGRYLRYLKVYGREGKKCFRCQAKIEKINLAGRGTNFCPKCQK